MNEIVFDFNQVNLVTQNIDYSYAFNGESLVFSPMPSSQQTTTADTLSKNKRFIFLANVKKNIIFPLYFGKSRPSLDNLAQTNSDNDSPRLVDSSFTSALAISNDSMTVAIGGSDGCLSILTLNSFYDSIFDTGNNDNSDINTNKNRIDLPNNSCTNYKFIHKNEITNMTFLKGNRRLIIGDKTGMITLLSFVSSFTCEILVQTTIINLKMPYYMFEVYPEDNVFAFASQKGFSVLRAGRRIEVLLCSDEELENSEICCSIDNFIDDKPELNSQSKSDDNSKGKDSNISKNRILICKNRSIFVYDIEAAENRKIEQWSFDLPDNDNEQVDNQIIQCFIINRFYYLLIFKDGNAIIIKDRTWEIVSTISDLPTNVSPSRIQLVQNVLIYFLKSDIVQKVIHFPSE